MVQKQAAYNRDPAGNAFADDDPLAELARLVGYDAPVARRVEPQISTPTAEAVGAGYGAPHQPVDLHNELLHDLDNYVDDRHAAPVQSAPIQSPPAQSTPTLEPLDQEIGTDATLADELLWSMSEVAVEPQQTRPGGADPTSGYGSHRLPLANFNPVRGTPQHQDDPPMQRQEPAPAPSQYDAPSVFNTGAYEAPRAASPSSSRQAEPDFDFGTAPSQRAQDASFVVAPERRTTVAAFQEPAFEQVSAPRRDAPSFFEDLSDQEDENPVARQPHDHQAGHQPVRPQEPVVEQATDEDFFAGDLELDLSEIELDMSEFEPEPAVMRYEPRAARVEAELPPVVQHQAPVQPVNQVQAVPQPTRAELPKDVATVPPAQMDSVPPLPFDASEISDQDDQLEVISHLDVPDLPPVDEEKPATFTPDYDFDIDAELANLLDKTAEKRYGQPAAPAQATVPSSAAVPPMAEHVKNMPSDDFDVFEKALEEDFRRSLDTQYSFGNKQAAPVVEEFDDGDFEVEEETSSPRRWIAIAAAAAVVLVAGGGVFAWMKSNGSVALGGGEPKIVMADKDPVKVVPANPGGKSVPNQNKAVYDRVSGTASDQPSQKSLISSGEEPMDVAQRTLGPDDLPMDDESGADVANSNADANAAATQPAGAAGDKQSLAPRRVKTMIVRPDGSLVAQDDGAAGSTTQTGNTQQTASVKQPSASAAPASTGQSVDDLLASGAAQSADAPADQPAAASDTAGVPAPNMPIPMTRPTQTASAAAAPAKLAAPAAQPSATPAAPAVSTAAATASAAGGDYLIQISSLPTEADAQKSYKNLSAKYGSVIGGRGMNIKAADVPGKGTYYRVRIPAGSKDAAVSLCERYRTAGGSCMVVR